MTAKSDQAARRYKDQRDALQMKLTLALARIAELEAKLDEERAKHQQ